MKKFIATLALIASFSAVAGWEYETKTDRMTGKPVKFASTVSDNSLRLGFPYGGENRGSLGVREHPQEGLDVYFYVFKGQILCSDYRGCNVRVRFDDAPPETFRGTPPTDHSSVQVFITDTRRFVEAASKAKRILVQVSMYQAGEQILEFKVAKPLKWGSEAKPKPLKGKLEVPEPELVELSGNK